MSNAQRTVKQIMVTNLNGGLLFTVPNDGAAHIPSGASAILNYEGTQYACVCLGGNAGQSYLVHYKEEPGNHKTTYTVKVEA